VDVDVEEDVEGEVEEEAQGAPSRAALEEWSRVQICAKYRFVPSTVVVGLVVVGLVVVGLVAVVGLVWLLALLLI